MKRRIIGFMSDWGRDDGAYGVCQAVIWGINPEVNISDMSQNVDSWDIKQGAFLLASNYQYYPKGSIFVVVIDPGVGTDRKAIIIETESGYIFIGPDNGVLTWALRKEKIKTVFQLTNEKYFLKVSACFEGRDIFSPVAAHVSRGVKSFMFGPKIASEEIIWKDFPLKKEATRIVGEVLFVDGFGNIVTSITEEAVKEFIGKLPLKEAPVKISVKEIEINGISHTFADATNIKPVAIFGEDFGDLMDIVLNQESAAEIFGVKSGDEIIIEMI